MKFEWLYIVCGFGFCFGLDGCGVSIVGCVEHVGNRGGRGKDPDVEWVWS